jgi:hypothetical protein
MYLFDAGKDSGRINLREIEVTFMSMYRHWNVGENVMSRQKINPSKMWQS